MKPLFALAAGALLAASLRATNGAKTLTVSGHGGSKGQTVKINISASAADGDAAVPESEEAGWLVHDLGIMSDFGVGVGSDFVFRFGG